MLVVAWWQILSGELYTQVPLKYVQICCWTALLTQRPWIWAHRSSSNCLNKKMIMNMLIKLKWIYFVGSQCMIHKKKKSGPRGRCMQLFGNKDWSEHEETEASAEQRLCLKRCRMCCYRGGRTQPTVFRNMSWCLIKCLSFLLIQFQWIQKVHLIIQESYFKLASTYHFLTQNQSTCI